MFLSPLNLVQAILLALGIWWCKEILSHWRDDLAKMREPDDQADRAVVVMFWGITAVVAFLCICFAVSLGRSIIGGIRDAFH